MPTLLEIERSFRRSLVMHDDSGLAGWIAGGEIAAKVRLDIHRSNFIGAVTGALHQSFPAVARLVGAPFFESATRMFIEQSPPSSACLNDYGGGFADFLERFAPAASLPYLPGVARLEWAVDAACHAPDARRLNIQSLSAIASTHGDRVTFVPHPSLRLVRAVHPVDEIQRAVLAGNDAAMGGIDLATGPVQLLVERSGLDVAVQRIDTGEADFIESLCNGSSLEEAIRLVPGLDVPAALAEHFRAGRFVEFGLGEESEGRRTPEAEA